MEGVATTDTAMANERKRRGFFESRVAWLMPSEEGFFQSLSLRHFGFTAGKMLQFALQQQAACGASMCVFHLDEAAADGRSDRQTSGCSPLAALASNLDSMKNGMDQTWGLLSRIGSWGPSVCGRVTASSWDVPADARSPLPGLLRLAAFLGLRAVLVPLPDGDVTTAAFTDAVTVLAEHLRQNRTTNVWVYCDASSQAHRVAFCRLRTALMWGDSPPSLTDAAGSVARESLHRVMPYLYFSETFGALPSEWLGEPVVAFEVPHIDNLMRALRSGPFHLEPDSNLPRDILPLINSYWATAQPPFISLAAFIVELLRRRAAPIFSVNDFIPAYTLLNQLYERHVLDNRRDNFSSFEDVLQLPLQPLGHMLPSGVYEVFECDFVKYQRYHAAMLDYFREWLEHLDERGHGRMCSQYLKDTERDKMDVAYVVLLGAGRGPLITECLAAASSIGVCVHLFAVEKNPEAMEFIRLRLRSDPQWRYNMSAGGHVVETMCVDGRAVTATIEEPLPKLWGLCDLVVSELLGSFGDNELSPECIEGFYEDLRRYQTSMGIPPNPHMVSIPQEYTAWIAPLYSGRMEECLADTAVSGLTVLLPWCHDRRAAIFHSMFVTDLCRGVSLSTPQPCWTFQHLKGKDFQKEREALLTFRMNTAGRCSGFIGYFTAVLYASKSTSGTDNVGNVCISTTLSTTPEERTPEMFSWFPCFFAVEPRAVLEVEADDRLQLHLRRCVNEKEKRVFYSYDAKLLKGYEGEVKATTVVINDGGWAASILLTS
ncbi:arginine N-methyltransferase, type II, putative [Trypanosoma cruzi marinkellei]|uniref:Arginine N-methyltransferase, type II, putative n=1 Tax=Trypanosoma cruzi marinkellei TaxID=85056 RepID=K2NQ39_TRYCR|nr:arginine N-methyltransferase, type II, putative [Trypanosoma cruzi marinkellei]